MGDVLTFKNLVKAYPNCFVICTVNSWDEITKRAKTFSVLQTVKETEEMKRAVEHHQKKEENGVVCFMTQPVLSERGLQNLKRARAELSAKILGGIYPIVSYRNACFMHNEITGVEVTSEIRHMYEGKTRDECKAIALNISTDIAGKMADYVDGYYIMTPFNRVKLVGKIIKAIRENGYLE